MDDAYCSCRRGVDNNSHSHSHSHSQQQSCYYNPCSLAAWDLHNNNLAFLNSSNISLLGMDRPYFGSLVGGYDSSGYLEDVLHLLDYANSTKRRKLLLYSTTTPPHQDSTSLLNDTSTRIIGPSLSPCSWESIRSRKSGVTVDQECMEQANYNWSLEDTFSSSVIKDIDTMSPPKYGTTTSGCDDHEEDKSSLFSIPPNCQENNNEERRMKKKMMRSTKRRRSLVYPFALVKPGGEEGDVTLNDINERLLMPPTRPIPHPVGHFACVSKPHGPGLSGKAVVALTTIRTLGRGTITIIRTKP